MFSSKQMQRFRTRLHELQIDVDDGDLENILEEVSGVFDPEDIFPDTDLEEWAYQAGLRWPAGE